MQGQQTAQAGNGAARSVRIWHWVLLAGALGCAMAGVVLGGPGGSNAHAGRLFAAAFGVLAGVAMVWASAERATREPHRYQLFLISGIGTGIVLMGQTLGYLATANDPGHFDPRIETLPLLIGMPLACYGAVRLTWPPGMSRRERQFVLIDSALAVSAMWVIWVQMIAPPWAPVADSDLTAFTGVDQILLFLGFTLVIVLMAASRRMGAMPLPQLLLMLGGVLVWLVSDLVGELGRDRIDSVTVSIIGYTVATAMLVGMAHRSAAEVETPRQTKWRDGLSLLLPMLLLLFGGLLVIRSAAATLSPGVLAMSAVVWILMLVGLTYTRIVSMMDMRASQTLLMSALLAESAARGWVGALLRDSSEYVLVLDRHGNTVFASPRTQNDLAQAARLEDIVIEPDPSALQTLLAGIAAQSVSAGPYEMLLRDDEGGQREVEVHLRPVIDMEFEGFVVIGTDITDVRRLTRSLDSTRRRDGLTGLLSPGAIHTEVAAQLTVGLSKGFEVLVAVLDLIDFGVWNDSLGRQGGDEILKSVARQFEGLPPEVKAVGRVDGDTFAIVMACPYASSALEGVVERLERSLTGLILSTDVEVDLTFRLGYSIATPGQISDPGQLMEQADVALRRARKSKQARMVQFSPGMNEDLVNRLSAELRIREALNTDGIIVHYQPILSLTDGSVQAVEALARLRTPHGAVIGPDAFMEAAEYSGLVTLIDREVRRQVASDWHSIAALTGEDLRININVSQVELVGELAAELEQARLTRRVIVEVTEASLLANPEVAWETLETIRRAGGIVAIDDFGTGYSSLSQIVALPCDMIKIDRSFVSDMSETSTTSRLVRAMVQLAEDLGLQTVAEGVETGEQAAILRALGCNRAQGFHYSPPLPLTDLLRWIMQRREPPSARPRPNTYAPAVATRGDVRN